MFAEKPAVAQPLSARTSASVGYVPSSGSCHVAFSRSGYRPVNIAPCDGNVHDAVAIARSNVIAVSANCFRFSVVGRSYP